MLIRVRWKFIGEHEVTEGEASEFSDVASFYQFDLLILIVFGLQIL